MRISIITPSYNQAAFLEATILSVLEQDYEDVEYIVIDGGSTDDSVDIIKKYASRLSYWVSEKDAGQTDAINKGFARATGEILAWINSDDTYQPGALRAATSYMREHPEVSLLYGDANYIDEVGNVSGKFPAAQTDLKRLRQGYVHIPQQSAFFRAEDWQRVGPLDPSFYFAMDYDLWVRLSTHGKVQYLPRLWSNFRIHGQAKSSVSDDRCWPEMIRVHFRDGGTLFSIIMIKYYLRRLLGPLWPWRMRLQRWLKGNKI